MIPVDIILHPTDFSDSSRLAFGLACSLAREHGSRLVVLYVNPTWGPLIAIDGLLTQLAPQDYRERLVELLHRLRPTDPDTPVEYRLEDGDPVETILRVADEDGCDLIVMGSRGHSPLECVVMGTVARRVVNKAPCAVVTVRTPRSVRTRGKAAPVRTALTTQELAAGRTDAARAERIVEDEFVRKSP